MKDEIYVNEPLSFRKIMEILEKNPDLKKITCPPSLYSRISPKYLKALDELGVDVVPIQKKGRPKKYDDKKIEEIRRLIKSGQTPQEISETLNIPLKTVYYLKDSPLKRGRKIKYPPQKVQLVKKLYKDGISAREIAFRLEIPIRTVYSLLKR
ncbi:MAG: helix-turn-helix domain-containing protein [Methanobacteriaceae archaeon]|nr:helix-turn-helix domain-containing protein [Methanobacteriaceae archaeon]